MNNYEKIEGKREGSVNYVSKGFIFVKNLAVKNKIYLRCHRWRDQCKGTAEVHSGFLSIVKKCDHHPEHNAVKRRITESVIKDKAETTCTSFRQTNSEVECFHWGLLQKIQVHHPNFWVFLQRIKIIVKSYFLEMNEVATGSETRKRRSKFSKTVDAAIKHSEERLRDGRLTLLKVLKRGSRANEKSFHKLETLGDEDRDENEDPTESGDDKLE